LASADVFAFFRGQALRFLTGRHAIQAAAVVMALFVTTANIRASEMTAVDAEKEAGKSVMQTLAEQTYTDEVDPSEGEADVDDTPAVVDVAYLDGQALEASDALDSSYDPATEELIEESDRAEPFADAVQVEPEYVPDQSGAAPSRTKIAEYEVQEGDSVAAIAERFGLKPATVLSANGLSARSVIRPGAKLRIPPVDGIVYVVKRGDTVAAIAKRLSSETAEILEANALGDADTIVIGTELIVPGGVMPAPVPSRTSVARAPAQSNSYRVPADADDSLVASGQMIWPAGCRRISQYYKGRTHTGVDIACPLGTPLYAADSGVVIYAGWNSGGYGYMTIVDHQNGYFTRYGHQKKGGVLVSVGERVRRGQVIGLMGSTGRSTGPHLHFEVMRGSLTSRLNPLSFIR
jgi:murein DD-endopeptidase MepM/ murein hydrolase activator NlpD